MTPEQIARRRKHIIRLESAICEIARRMNDSTADWMLALQVRDEKKVAEHAGAIDRRRKAHDRLVRALVNLADGAQ